MFRRLTMVLFATLFIGLLMSVIGAFLVSYAGKPWGDPAFWTTGLRGFTQETPRLFEAAISLRGGGLYLGVLLAFIGLFSQAAAFSLLCLLFGGAMLTDNITQHVRRLRRRSIETIGGEQDVRAGLSRSMLGKITDPRSYELGAVRALFTGVLKNRQTDRSEVAGTPAPARPLAAEPNGPTAIPEWADLLNTTSGIARARREALRVFDQTTREERQAFAERTPLGLLAIQQLEAWAEERRLSQPEDEEEKAAYEVATIFADRAEADSGDDVPAGFADETIDEAWFEEDPPETAPSPQDQDGDVTAIVETAQASYALLVGDRTILSERPELASALADAGIAKGMAIVNLGLLQKQLNAHGGEDFVYELDESVYSPGFTHWLAENIETLRNDAASLAMGQSDAQQGASPADDEDTSPDAFDGPHDDTGSLDGGGSMISAAPDENFMDTPGDERQTDDAPSEDTALSEDTTPSGDTGEMMPWDTVDLSVDGADAGAPETFDEVTGADEPGDLAMLDKLSLDGGTAETDEPVAETEDFGDPFSQEGESADATEASATGTDGAALDGLDDLDLGATEQETVNETDAATKVAPEAAPVEAKASPKCKTKGARTAKHSDLPIFAAIETAAAAAPSVEPEPGSVLGDDEEITSAPDAVAQWARTIEHGLMTEDVSRSVPMPGAEGSSSVTLALSGEDGDGRKVGVLLRHVPEGQWTLRTEGGVFLENGDGAQIGLSNDMLKASDLDLLLIHFHGPGGADVIADPVRRTVFVVPRVLDSEELEKALTYATG